MYLRVKTILTWSFFTSPLILLLRYPLFKNFHWLIFLVCLPWFWFHSVIIEKFLNILCLFVMGILFVSLNEILCSFLFFVHLKKIIFYKVLFESLPAFLLPTILLFFHELIFLFVFIVTVYFILLLFQPTMRGFLSSISALFFVVETIFFLDFSHSNVWAR